MRTLTLVARILLGVIFVFFGFNFFFNFIHPPPPPKPGLDFFLAMVATGYIFYLLKVLEIACGLALLVGRYVPLALTVLAPIVVNIVFFHAFLAPVGVPLAAVVLILEVFLAWGYRDAFAGVLNPKAQPKA